jgi:hypothetical protein
MANIFNMATAFSLDCLLLQSKVILSYRVKYDSSVLPSRNASMHVKENSRHAFFCTVHQRKTLTCAFVLPFSIGDRMRINLLQKQKSIDKNYLCSCHIESSCLHVHRCTSSMYQSQSHCTSPKTYIHSGHVYRSSSSSSFERHFQIRNRDRHQTIVGILLLRTCSTMCLTCFVDKHR